MHKSTQTLQVGASSVAESKAPALIFILFFFFFSQLALYMWASHLPETVKHFGFSKAHKFWDVILI